MTSPSAVVVLLKRFLATRYGVFPLLDLWLKLTRPHLTWLWRLREDRIVAMAREVLGPLPAASVTVVLPTYKRPTLLLQAVKSVLAQSHEDLVLLIVDDGGGEVPALPDDPRIRLLQLRDNTRMVGIINNVGIRLANSEYIALLNDDNLWRSNHLEVSLAALAGGADVSYTAMTRVHGDGSILDTLGVPFDRRLLARRSFVDSNVLVFRRSKKLLFSRVPRDVPPEDWEFAWRASRRHAVTFTNESTVVYLVNEHSYFTDWEDKSAS